MDNQPMLFSIKQYKTTVYDSIINELHELKNRPATKLTLYRLEELEKRLKDFLESLPIDIETSSIYTNELDIVRDNIYDIKSQIRQYKYLLQVAICPEFNSKVTEDIILGKEILEKWRGNYNGINDTTTEN